MLKYFFYLISVSILTACSVVGNKTAQFFSQGEVSLPEDVENLTIEYRNRLPFVKVIVGGIEYNFLIDTGAPTAISSAIFKQLVLKSEKNITIMDSQGKAKKEKLVVIPELKVGNLIAKNIGCVVLDFNSLPFSCLKTDGIIGANLLAQMVCKFDYQNSSLQLSKQIQAFDSVGYDWKIPFQVKKSKTPVVEIQYLGTKRKFIFDTGSNGDIDLKSGKSEREKFEKLPHLKKKGVSSAGIYGNGKGDISYVFQAKDLTIGNKTMQRLLVETKPSNLIGNRFLENYAYIIDWKNQYIYLKPTNEKSLSYKTLGFAPFYYEQKMRVAWCLDSDDFPLKVGDEIVAINDRNLENISPELFCEWFVIGEWLSTFNRLTIKIKRNNTAHEFTLDKKEFFN